MLTDDTALGGSSDPTVTDLSKHSLGNLIFRDNNKNGVFDGGDVGIDGVVVNLYRDNGTTRWYFRCKLIAL
ncbi:MAG: SdrD B-like domain-containing protein [Spirosomataceae bacterium]